MNPLVVAFNNQYLVLKSQKLSGWSEEDFRSGTQDKYNAIYGSSFRHEHGTEKDKKDRKEKSTASTSSSKSRLDEILEKHVEDNKKAIDRHHMLKEKKIKVEVEKLKVEAIKTKNKEIAIIFKDPNKMEDFVRELWKNRAMEIKENVGYWKTQSND
ncbi:hypothetical protein Tco_0211525 [Tanacetum coccineum]